MNPSQIAEAVKDQLVAETLSIEPKTVLRSYTPTLQLSDIAQLHLVVVQRSHLRERLDETAWNRETTIDVAVLYKFPTGSTRDIPASDIDAIDAVADEIMEFFANEDEFGNAPYEPPGQLEVVEVKRDMLFVPEYLIENRQYASVVSVTFREGF